MSIMRFSLEDVLAIEGESARGCALKFSYSSSHSDREMALMKLMDFLCNELEKNKHVKLEDMCTEDSLTIDLVSMLKSLKIDAAHDKQHGGHCDIVVEGSAGFLWIAEAKKHGGYAWLEKGFRQLATRYSTGVDGQDTGEIIIYCWQKNASSVLERWRCELARLHQDVTVDNAINQATLTFNSTHPHCATGRSFRVRHKIVSLYFSPDDK